MSISYRVRPALPWDKLFGNLPDGVSESVTKETTEVQRCLTNDDGYIWAYRNDDGSDVTFERWGINYKATSILDAIAGEFGVAVLSEHDAGFWDPADQVEMDIENYHTEWMEKVKELGEDGARKEFQTLAKRAKELDIELVNQTYPDGKSLEV